MEERTYWQFFNPTELTLIIVDGYGGTVSKAEMHIRTTEGAHLNIVLLGPTLIRDIHSDLTELSGDLTEVSEVLCFRDPPADGTLRRCKIEITRDERESDKRLFREIIECDELEGLPP